MLPTLLKVQKGVAYLDSSCSLEPGASEETGLGGSTMAELICPKCGGYAEIMTDTCPRCRVAVSKYRAYLQNVGKRPETPQAELPRSRKKGSWLDKIKKHLRRIRT